MIALRPARPEDLGFVTGLERRPDHVEAIGQWSDLEHLANRPAESLGLLHRKRLELARALATEPQVLLLDEPSSGIAQAEAEGLAPLLKRVRFETGCSILIIEHDMPLISAVSDELIALDQGRFVTRGRPADVLEDERVVESYLGTTEEAVNRSGSIG